MRQFKLIGFFLIFGIVAIYGQQVDWVKVGYEVALEGPFPTAVVFHDDTVIISWKTTGIQGNVIIELIHQNQSLAQTISSGYPVNDIPKAVKVSSALTPGKYFVRIRQGLVSGLSGQFEIRGPRSIKWVNVFHEGKKKSAKTFYSGQTLAVSWDTSHLVGQVTVILRKKSRPMIKKLQLFISKNRPYDDIPATYKIPLNVKSGNYVVVVKQRKTRCSSKPFKIKKLKLQRTPRPIKNY